MAPAEDRNVRNKLFLAVLAVVFMIKISTCLPSISFAKQQN